MSVRLALFDYDGTLVDSAGPIVQMFEAAYTKAGHNCPSADVLRSMIGLPLHVAVARLNPNLDEAGQAEIVDFYRAEYDSRHAAGAVSPLPLFAGAEQAMAEMQSSMILGIATGKSRRGLTQSLAALGLNPFFTVTKTADDGPSKPHPAIALAAMDEMGADPANTVVIGDTVYDMEMAKAAGASAIGVSWGMHPVEQLQRAGADRLITSFEELPNLALELTGM